MLVHQRVKFGELEGKNPAIFTGKMMEKKRISGTVPLMLQANHGQSFGRIPYGDGEV